MENLGDVPVDTSSKNSTSESTSTRGKSPAREKKKIKNNTHKPTIRKGGASTKNIWISK